MADTLAFAPPDSQSEYAFPAGQGEGDDEAAQSEQRNQSIQQSFDAQRFQRTMAQNLGKALSKQAGEIAQLRAQQKT
jgi:hypothetical protein